MPALPLHPQLLLFLHVLGRVRESLCATHQRHRLGTQGGLRRSGVVGIAPAAAGVQRTEQLKVPLLRFLLFGGTDEFYNIHAERLKMRIPPVLGDPGGWGAFPTRV